MSSKKSMYGIIYDSEYTRQKCFLTSTLGQWKQKWLDQTRTRKMPFNWDQMTPLGDREGGMESTGGSRILLVYIDRWTVSQEPAAGKDSRWRTTRYFLWTRGRDLEVLHSSWWSRVINCCSLVSEYDPTVALGWWPEKHLLQLSGPIGLSGYCKLRYQIVTINKNNLRWPMEASFSWQLLAKLILFYKDSSAQIQILNHASNKK